MACNLDSPLRQQMPWRPHQGRWFCAKVFEASLGVKSYGPGRLRDKFAMEDTPRNMDKETVAKLRVLAHDLSNSIENVMQASYLLAQSELDEANKKWLKMIDTAAQEAAKINREIREILRSQS
jgi:hypothetical protein